MRHKRRHLLTDGSWSTYCGEKGEVTAHWAKTDCPECLKHKYVVKNYKKGLVVHKYNNNNEGDRIICGLEEVKYSDFYWRNVTCLSCLSKKPDDSYIYREYKKAEVYKAKDNQGDITVKDQYGRKKHTGILVSKLREYWG